MHVFKLERCLKPLLFLSKLINYHHFKVGRDAPLRTMREEDGHISFGRLRFSTWVNLQTPLVPIAGELWCINIMILRSWEIFEILHLELERLRTAKQRSCLIAAILAIQARSWVFGRCVAGRQGDLDRDPLQKCHFAATKGLTAQTLAPDYAHGRGRSRQVEVRSG